MDVLYLGITFGFFAMTALLVRFVAGMERSES
jgi:hypothetical protein